MTKVVHGIVHGKTIELAEDLGIADGQEVQMVVRIVKAHKSWGEGIRRSAGGWADYPEMDKIMEEIQQDRKRERSSQGGL